MRAILLQTGELSSPRWHRLCGLLGAREPGDRWQAFGHLVGWYLRWAGQPELDSGIWFRASLNEIGAWAGVDKGDLKWGRALLAAGYVGDVAKLYPAPLAGIREGYAALDSSGGVMIDDIFTLLRGRAAAPTLALYILNRQKRVYWANRLNVDGAVLEIEGIIPAGWLDNREERGHAPEDAPIDAGEPPARATVTSAPDAAAVRRPVVGFAGASGPTAERTSGKPSSEEMLRTVREFKHADPLRALLAMDSSTQAALLWRRAVAKDRARVSEELSSLTETDQCWWSMRNPSAIVMASFRRLGLIEKGRQ